MRIDPTRTIGLMRPFCIRLRAMFKGLEQDLRKLIVEEDAFGLKPKSIDPFINNNNQNQPRDSHGRWVAYHGTNDRAHEQIMKSGFGKINHTGYYGAGTYFFIDPELGAKQASGYGSKIIKAEVAVQNPFIHEQHAEFSKSKRKNLPFLAGPDSPFRKQLEDMIDKDPTLTWSSALTKLLKEKGHDGVISWEDGKQILVAFDTSQISTQPTTNTRWKFETNPQKLKAFQTWLKTAFVKHLKNQSMDKLWEAYILEGFRKGAGRAFDDTKQEEGKKPDSVLPDPRLDFYNGTKAEFLRSSFGQPETIEKVKLLASRTYDGMEGVTTTMATKMSRILTDGLVQGMHPYKLAKLLSSEINIGEKRAETIARTELIRAHAEGQLMAFQKLGVEEVGAAVEWSTAGDDRVCPLCKPLEGIVLKTSEATGMIPRHPNCRCAWIPANVGEKDPSKLRTKKQIESAILRSARKGKDDFSTAKKLSKARPTQGF